MDGTLRDLTSALVQQDLPTVTRLIDDLRLEIAEHLHGRVDEGRSQGRQHPRPYINVPEAGGKTKTLAVYVCSGTADTVGHEIHTPVSPSPGARSALVVVIGGWTTDDGMPERVDGFEVTLVGPVEGRDEWRLRDDSGRLRDTTTLRAGLDRIRSGSLPELVVPEAEPVVPEAVTAPMPPVVTVVTDRPSEPAVAVPSFLLVADEWESRHGGISTFNREFAVALRTAGADVRVLVPEVSESERDAAEQADVTLIGSTPALGLSGKDLLLTKPPFAGDDYRPDVIVGHGRLLGPYAEVLRRDYFPAARRLHIVHTDAESLEVAKEWPGDESRMEIAGQRTQDEIDLAGTADLVAGVGPWLSDAIADDLLGQSAAPPVFRLTPGLRVTDNSVVKPPSRREVLLIGRAEDFRSKGIDIAVQAVEIAVKLVSGGPSYRPTLVIRGVPKSDAQKVKDHLDELSTRGFKAVMREFRPDEKTLWEDLRKARVVIMPSRHEGFGLAAYEAIAATVPVLITAESGLAHLLRELKIEDGDRSQPREIVSMDGTDEEIAQRWGEEIARVLLDPAGSVTRAADLRAQINAKVSWAATVAELFETLGRLPAQRPGGGA
ncbi:glycosyltransferase family 4 protein [Actinoplanes sp. HUAS TT8]|uniref:glycosyltransferase family 4 protein n=1 Tax=Actinoplanes sp. HUAS TT8 TaxID=3447453 RepID=UPI003F5279F4